MGYCSSTEPLEPQTGVHTHSQALLHEDLQGALGEDWKQGDKTTRKNLPWWCRHEGEDQVPLRQRYEIPPRAQTLLSKALSVWGIGGKSCHTQGISKDPWWLGGQRRKSFTSKQGAGKIPDPRICYRRSSSTWGETGSCLPPKSFHRCKVCQRQEAMNWWNPEAQIYRAHQGLRLDQNN